ncbi:hypothetical protein CNR22_06180 [Sphingobacteriaceae bacterium]|nr:hypothetical protein CNR22_06180 [Sphingobacteriaceae bacterium]
MSSKKIDIQIQLEFSFESNIESIVHQLHENKVEFSRNEDQEKIILKEAKIVQLDYRKEIYRRILLR